MTNLKDLPAIGSAHRRARSRVTALKCFRRFIEWGRRTVANAFPEVIARARCMGSLQRGARTPLTFLLAVPYRTLREPGAAAAWLEAR